MYAIISKQNNRKDAESMKKFLSILLAVILAFSALTMVSFAEETTDPPTDTPDVPTDIYDSMYAKWVDEYLNSGFFNNEISMKISVFSSEFDSPFYAFIKNGKMVVDIPHKIGPFNTNLKLIADSNNERFQVYSTLFPLFYLKYDVDSSSFNDIFDEKFADYSDFVLDSVSKVQVSGTEYYVEKMSGNLSAYFKDGELVRLELIEADSNVLTFEISYSVSDKDVNLPFYAFIDVTPIFDFFSSL